MLEEDKLENQFTMFCWHWKRPMDTPVRNLLFVKEIDTPNRFGGIGYMGFEKLTFVPIQTKMVDLSLLSTAEIDWLNDYHHQTWEKVSPLVSGSVRQWLWNNTRPVGKPN
ncbi:unnamed protein product [Fraxinus pennsylvanica]|uniref:Peptidase M24 C-terminal domain-containing protein n=1 Tax=Fraxinus pennsylvanica TaxID=56036 RepID=A0AAD1Z6S7_9LAMI|nr:unnamed protein product [Fraxinus pennsylvanica]